MSDNNNPKTGSVEWLKAMSTGPIWEYLDALGILHSGYMGRYLDHGGSDHTAMMYDSSSGELSVVSGSRLKAMRVKSVNRSVANPNFRSERDVKLGLR